MNDRLKQLVSQFKDVWQGMSARRRLLIGGAIGAVFLALMFIGLGPWGDGGKEVLFSGLDAVDAAEVLARLDDASVPWDLRQETDGRIAILVPRPYVYRTRIDLAAEGLPAHGSVGFEIFDETRLGMTDDVRRINLRRALNGELERTIRAMDAVQDARVQVALPQTSLFISEQQKPTAAVMVTLHTGARLSAAQVGAIQRLVGATVEGLDPADVFVVDNRGTPLSDQLSSLADSSGLNSLEQRLLLQQAISGEYTRRARSLLEGPFGVGRVEAMVHVELDFERAEEIIRAYEAPNGDRGIVRSRQIFEEIYEGRGTSPGGVPGVESNVPGFPAILQSEGPLEYLRTEEIVNYEINETETRREIPPGAVKRVTVAVIIDGELSDAAKASVSDTLTTALGLNADRGDLVTVDSMRFVSADVITQLPELQVWGIPPSYALWSAALLALLAVVYAAARRRTIRVRGVDIVLTDETEGDHAAGRETTAEERRRQELRDRLSEVARENPQDVAQLVKAWLADE